MSPASLYHAPYTTSRLPPEKTTEGNRGFGYGIEPSDMISIMDEAKTQGLWRAPMGRVAAYYRAHFVIDKATATSIDV